MTNAEIKWAKSLSLQKYRKEHNAYLITGDKLVKEWILARAPIQKIVATSDWFVLNQSILGTLEVLVEVVPQHTIDRIAPVKSAPNVIAVVQKEPAKEYTPREEGWTLVLDRVQDPGNMGTIIRIADWFGIQEVIVNKGCVELYNPKVIQATMGSFLRVQVYVQDLEAVIRGAHKQCYAACLDGVQVSDLEHEGSGYLFMGNESQGLDPELMKRIEHKVTIPQIGRAESLNVGVATGILCSHLCLEKA